MPAENTQIRSFRDERQPERDVALKITQLGAATRELRVTPVQQIASHERQFEAIRRLPADSQVELLIARQVRRAQLPDSSEKSVELDTSREVDIVAHREKMYGSSAYASAQSCRGYCQWFGTARVRIRRGGASAHALKASHSTRSCAVYKIASVMSGAHPDSANSHNLVEDGRFQRARARDELAPD